jgi:GNAT superfamily N-acetyltransferase
VTVKTRLPGPISADSVRVMHTIPAPIALNGRYGRPVHSKLGVTIHERPPVDSDELNELRAIGWPEVGAQDWDTVLSHSLGWVTARAGDKLVGFVNVAWDGGSHAFLLDTVVHPRVRRQGVGKRLVERAAALARKAGAEWLHVDFDPEVRAFYEACGFRPTDAGLLALRPG